MSCELWRSGARRRVPAAAFRQRRHRHRIGVRDAEVIRSRRGADRPRFRIGYPCYPYSYGASWVVSVSDHLLARGWRHDGHLRLPRLRPGLRAEALRCAVLLGHLPRQGEQGSGTGAPGGCGPPGARGSGAGPARLTGRGGRRCATSSRLRSRGSPRAAQAVLGADLAKVMAVGSAAKPEDLMMVGKEVGKLNTRVRLIERDLRSLGAGISAAVDEVDSE